jgi:hypothetical protein
MGTLRAFSGRIASTVSAKHLRLDHRGIIAPVLAHLPAKITRHLAVPALRTVVIIDRIAVVTD